MKQLPRRPISASTALALLLASPLLAAQAGVDSDHDGLSDDLEQRLLVQFAPHFMVAEHDCSGLPAEFRQNVTTPEVAAENGTIYGQVFLQKNAGDPSATAEIHFFHLWRKDCGGHGHPLDTEHVAVLVHASGPLLDQASWQALFWYAAAHEDTVCDVSQIARASTLHAVNTGATVWLSPGKHASYLDGTLCRRGCGADHCVKMVPLKTTALINLGEPHHPMNGAVFIAAPQWPLMAKMSATNFPAEPLARLNQLPATDIAWFHPGRHPAQGIIARSSATEQALATGSANTDAAISVAGSSTTQALDAANISTGNALDAAGNSTGSALSKTYNTTRGALGKSASGVGHALHLTRKNQPAKPEPAPAPDK